MDHEGDVIMEDVEQYVEEIETILFNTDDDGDVIMEDVEHCAANEPSTPKASRRTRSSSKKNDQVSKAKKRKAKNYSEDQVEKLATYYFTDNLTVKEASKKCRMNLSSAYKYIRKMKDLELQYVFYDGKSRNDAKKRQLNILLSALKALVV
ncbi:unnamed protein product [Mucor hiemalis]